MQERKALKTIFDIRSETGNNKEQVLLIELGVDYCNYAFLDELDKSISQLTFITGSEFEMEQTVQSILNSLEEKEFSKVFICSALPQALLIPQKYYQNNQLTQLVYDQPAQRYLQDSIPEWQIINSYSIPERLVELFSSAFPSAFFLHTFTSSLKIYNGFPGDQLSVHFSTQHFRVIVKNDGQLLLTQIYFYKTPLDVVYYLLKICSEFQLDQSQIQLVLSGLVETDSALYKELHHYFLNINFAQAPLVSLPENDYPQHFFTSFYNLAVCVS